MDRRGWTSGRPRRLLATAVGVVMVLAAAPAADAGTRPQPVTGWIRHHAAQNLRWWRSYSGDKVLYWGASAHTAAVPRMLVSFPDDQPGDDTVAREPTPPSPSTPGAAPSTRFCTSTASHPAACWLPRTPKEADP